MLFDSNLENIGHMSHEEQFFSVYFPMEIYRQSLALTINLVLNFILHTNLII